MEIHERIQAARKHARISMSEIARQLGVSPQSVRQWERGLTTPRPQRIHDLAVLLGVSEAYLLGATEELAPVAGSDAPGAPEAGSALEIAQAMAASIVAATENGRLRAEDLEALAHIVDRLQSQ